MPRLSVYLIRTAFVYLAIGFTFGGLLLFNKAIPLDPQLRRLLPLHIELVLVGWTMQLAMGVAFWILPRFSHGGARGNERPAWAAYILFNLGVISIALSQWLTGSDAFVIAGRVCELSAAILFAIHVWPRVRSLGA